MEEDNEDEVAKQREKRRLQPRRAEEIEADKRLSLFASIVESSQDAIIGMQLDGEITSWNPAAEQIYGYTFREMKGRKISLLVPPESIMEAQEILQRVRQGERVDPYETVRITKDGRRIVVSTTTSPIRDRHGRIVGASSITRDITRRKAAEEMTRKLSSVIEQTDDIVVITDKKGTIEYVNFSFEMKTGYGKGEAIGRNPRILKSGEHGSAYYSDLWEKILRGDVFQGVVVNKKKNGELYLEEKTITPLKDPQGRITHFVSTGKDITERVEMERKLEEIRIRKERLEAIQMLSLTYAHNIFNAITPTKSYAQLLLKGVDPSDPKARWAQAILDGIEEVVRLIRGFKAVDPDRTTELGGRVMLDVARPEERDDQKEDLN